VTGVGETKPPAHVLDQLARALGPIESTRPLSGNAWMVQVRGRDLVAKVGPGSLDESAGLHQLGDVRGAPPVPDVVFAEADLLVTTAVDQAPRTAGHDDALGRALATLHRAPCPNWGGGSSWIGACPVQPSPAMDGAGFYGARLLELATRCGLEAAVNPVVSRLPELLPPGGPALLHGDLWWGNVLFGSDGRSWLIDPSVHGGHPEEDLAMLALFGAVPARLLQAYIEVLPLNAGWEERVTLFQLPPLLVHAVLFGGGYRAQVQDVARRFH
jgi:fructosamine-3-kinase